MKVLVLNLTRFGDILQTQPVLSGFKARGCETTLVCLENFLSASGLLHDVDRVVPLKGARLLARTESRWPEALACLKDFQNTIQEEVAPDLVVNLTPSTSGRLLARSFHVNVEGFGLDEFGFNADSSSWAAFLQMASGNRGASPFNVCDLFLRSAGIGHAVENSLAHPDGEAVRVALEFLPDMGNGYLALQMGASEERRRWPVKSFREFASAAHKRFGMTPVLLGTDSERPLAQRFMQGIEFPVVDLMGRTGLKTLAAVLQRCKALVTNDTGTMHLAAGLGVPVTAVFLATAQPWDTGPYQQGCVCLEPSMDCHPCAFGRECSNDHACRNLVPSEDMLSALQILLEGQAENWSGKSRVWRTLRDHEGFMNLESLSGHESEDRTAWIRTQRRIYRRFLDGEPLDEGVSVNSGLSPEFTSNIFSTLDETTKLLDLLAQQGMLLSRGGPPAIKEKFLSNWQRMETALRTCKNLDVLGLLWRFEAASRDRDLSMILEMIQRYRLLVSAFLSGLGL